MKKIALGLILSFIFVSSANATDLFHKKLRVIALQTSEAAPIQTCTQRFSDNFNRPDSTTLDGGWTEAAGDLSIVSGVLNVVTSPGIAANSTELTSHIQWGQFKIVDISTTYIGTIIAIDLVGSTESYTISVNNANVAWDDVGGTVDSSGALSWSVGDYVSYVRTGTGDSTVISVWKKSSASVPFSGGGQCADDTKPCWDDTNDTPDIQMAGNPTVPADTYNGIGVYMAGVGRQLDDLSYGDCSE